MIYLDHAATAPVPRAVADEMYRVLTEQYANPSSQYGIGLDMARAVEGWRETVASALGCEAKRLCFTSCGTESDAWAVQAGSWQNRHRSRHIVTTGVEHAAVIESCKWMERQGYRVTYVPPRPDGWVDAMTVLNAVGPGTALVSVMLVNNELGDRYPIEEIAKGLRDRNPDTLLHTDASQAFLKVPFTVKELGADLVTVSAHKIGGPKGIGALYVGPRLRNPRPLLPGGGQEHGLRSGTEATAQIAGFAKAVELRRASFPEDEARLRRIRAYAVERLLDIPDIELVGGQHETAPHILSVSLAGWPSGNIVSDLSAQGICVSAGSACHRGRPSHVIASLRLPKRAEQGVIRLSFGPETTEAEIDACAGALRRHHDERMPLL